MKLYQPLTEAATFSFHAVQQLEHKLTVLRQQNSPIRHFEDDDNDVHRLFAQAERDVLAEDVSGLDINVPAVEVNGTCYHRTLLCSETYPSAASSVQVLRTLYRNGKDHSMAPLKLRVGIVEGYRTPGAARQAAWMVARSRA